MCPCILNSIEQRQGGGVGERRREVSLVEVEADADNRGLEQDTDGILDEDATDLAIAHVDVVGPFHLGTHAIAFEQADDGQGHGLAERELQPGREIHRVPQQAEEQVLARGREPHVTALAAPSRLVVGIDGQVPGWVQAPQLGVGGVKFCIVA